MIVPRFVNNIKNNTLPAILLQRRNKRNGLYTYYFILCSIELEDELIKFYGTKTVH